MSLLRHSLDSFEGVMPRKKLAVWLQERALKQADREGHTWTPLLDTYQCTEAHHQQCPSIPNLEDRLDQLADWARQRGSAEKLEGLLEFNAHLLLVRIAELPFPFEGPRGKAWLTGVTNPKRPSARPLRYEPLLRRLRKNSHLGPQALWAIFEGAPTPLDGLHGDPWFEFAEHPAAEGEHWVYLIKEQEPTYDVFHSYLPDQAWEHPKVQEAVLYEAKGEPDSPEYQYFLLRKLVRKGGGQGQQHLTKQLFQWPETRHSAFRLIEEGFLQVDHLSSQTMSKLLGDKDPELRQKAWNLLRKRNKEQKTWEPRR